MVVRMIMFVGMFMVVRMVVFVGMIMVMGVVVVVRMVVLVGMFMTMGMFMDLRPGAVQGQVMALFLLAVDPHLHAGAGDAAGDRRHRLHRYAGEKGVHGFQKRVFLPLVQQLVQSGHQHIAGGAHVAFQIQCFHSQIPSMRLMRLARKPAPKPLSIFTTLMPLAQAFSMDSSALSPPKEAP